MKGTVVLAIAALLSCCNVSANDAGTNSQSRQKRDQILLTTPASTTDTPIPSTTISISPQTSISVHHTIVRNKPAYPYPYTESTLQSDGTEDTSYYYTYEDISEEASKKITSTAPTPMISLSSAKPTTKSFWNSQKALLDARRKENAQKFIPTYNKPSSAPKEVKPAIEFKVREKPKFGLANKNKASSYTTTKQPEATTDKPVELSTNSKVVKSDKLNLPIQNLGGKDLLKALKNNNIFPNQIIGRVGDMPIQSNLASQLQSPLRAQSTNINSFGTSRPSKFDDSIRNVQFVDNLRPIQQPSLPNVQNQPSLLNSALLSNLNAQPLLNLNQQRSVPLNLNQQTPLNTQSLLNLNQKPQPLINNLNQAPANAFISASAPLGTSGRSGEINLQSPASSLLQRLGALGIGGNGGNNGLNGLLQGRDGGGGGGSNAFTVNLGSIPDPITFFLRLLSLIPRPLLDLNGKIFFGIELGKNAGLVSGAGGGAKPYNG